MASEIRSYSLAIIWLSGTHNVRDLNGAQRSKSENFPKVLEQMCFVIIGWNLINECN
jgi:hypothetical protein